MKHWFWLLATTACLVWYSTITIYVSVKGAADIRRMLKRLSDQAEEERRGAGPLAVLLAFALAVGWPAPARAAAPAAEATMHTLMPVPASVRFGSGRLVLPDAVTVASTGVTDPRLTAAVDRAMRRLEGRTAKTYPRGLASDAASATLVVDCRAAGAAIPSLAENESYTLEVTPTQARLAAPTVVGAIRGLETFLQLVEGTPDGYFLPVVSIADAPRFRWRGLMIDSARHFEPVEVILRNLDGMAAVKLNVFHWHLTDDQGFRIESKKYPKLHTVGSDGLFYSQDDVRRVIAYARDRGIRVVPEFDLPGHATSWVVGHPELASAPGPYQIERGAGIFEPTLDPTRDDVYKLLDGFLGEMAALFPDDYLHIGGDENTGKQWDRNPQIQAFMKSKGIVDNHALQAYFNKRLLEIVTKHGKRMMGWDEILHPDLPKNAVIHSWRGPEGLAAAATAGYDVVLSNGYYIDLIEPASRHYAVDPLPANTTLTPEQAKHVLGGEATMWGEYVGPETIDSRIWPRTAVIAERLWSPGTVTDVADMYRRMDAVSVDLEQLGLTHERNVGVLLRRIAGSDDVAPLATLVAAAEPVKGYSRGDQRPTTMLSPLTSLVDAARPDSREARRFGALVAGLLADAPRYAVNRAPVEAELARWRDVGRDYQIVAARAPALNEHAELARALSDVGTAGLEAMAYLEAGVAPPAGWSEARLATLDAAAKPRAALELVVVPAVRSLVLAASGRS
jgi:hexosaminidase